MSYLSTYVAKAREKKPEHLTASVPAKPAKPRFGGDREIPTPDPADTGKTGETSIRPLVEVLIARGFSGPYPTPWGTVAYLAPGAPWIGEFGEPSRR